MTDHTSTRYSPLQLLAQADLVFLLADLLRPPAAVEASRWQEALEALDELTDAAGLDESAGLATALRTAASKAASTPVAERSAEYHRLFEGRLLCPPNESAYVRRDKGAILADICGFYRAFGFDFRPETGEKPDHIVTQLEFCGVLLAMMASAPGDEQAQVAHEALVDFADQHLGEWLPWLAARLQVTAQHPAYGLIADALATAWSAMAAAHGLRAEPSATMGHPQDEPDEPYECAAPALKEPASIQASHSA